MIHIKNEFDTYLEIYGDKPIYEPSISTYWNATEESPIAVNKERYNRGDYVESSEDVQETLENVNKIVDNNE